MNTEIVDYANETFSLGTPVDPDSILFSSRPKVSNFSSSESSQEMGANYFGRNQHFLSSNHSQESGAANFFGNQHPRSFHRSLSQPAWGTQSRIYDSSSAESSQSDGNRVTREQVSELIKANLQLQNRVEALEGVLKFLAPVGRIPVGLAQLAPHSPVGSLPGSPFLTGPSLAGSPLNVDLNLNGLSLPVLSGSSPEIQLKRENFPNVKFWYRQDWLIHMKEGGNSTDVGEVVRGKSLMSKGINKTAKYIESAEGEPVDGYKVRDIRSHARAIWANFQTVGRAPPTWGRADAEITHVFRREMRSKFFEFSLCDNDWKADLLATEHYPSWYNNHIRVDDIKVEATANPTLSAGFKRSITEPLTANPTKRAKKVRNPLLNRKLGADTGNSLPLSPIILSDPPAFLNAETIPASSNTAGLSASPSVVVTDVRDTDSALNNTSGVTTTEHDPGQIHAHLSQPRSNQDSTLPQAPVSFTDIPSLIVTKSPQAPASILASSGPPLEGPPLEDSSVAPALSNESMTGFTASAPPTLVLAPAAPPKEDFSVTPEPNASMTKITATAPPALVLAPAAPPKEDFTVAPVLSMTGTMATTPPAPVLAPVVPPEDSSVAHVPSAGENEQRASKKGKMRPGPSLTARNLCAIDWCAKYPDGTAAEFKQYYDHEMSSDDKKAYEQRSKEAKAKKRS